MNSTDPTRGLEKFCSEYLTSLQAPQDIVASKLHLHSIIIMILPFTSKNMDRMLFKMPKVLKNLPVLKQIFCSIFRENSKSARKKFFENKLVQFLWTHYIHADEQ